MMISKYLRHFALAALVSCGAHASAQNVGQDPVSLDIMLRLQSEPLASRFPDDHDSFVDRFGFNISVPVEMDDVSPRVEYARITCDVVSSLMSSGSVVGTGTALLVPDTGGPVSELGIPEGFRMANWVPSDLRNGFEGVVEVPILSVPPHDVEGWTHGTCEMSFHYRPPGGGTMEIDHPVDCATTRADEDFALCSWPGTELITTQRFGRAGFDAEGRPLEAN